MTLAQRRAPRTCAYSRACAATFDVVVSVS
jgi:hypothetical protein